MLTVKCIEKFRDNKNNIYGYRLADINGDTRDVRPKDLKQAILSGQISVVNLKLTADGRLVDTTETQLKNIRLGEAPKRPTGEHSDHIGMETVFENALKRAKYGEAPKKPDDGLRNNPRFEKIIKDVFNRAKGEELPSRIKGWFNGTNDLKQFIAIINKDYTRDSDDKYKKYNTFKAGDYVVVRHLGYEDNEERFTINHIDGGFEIDPEVDFDDYYEEDFTALKKTDFTFLGLIKPFRDYNLATNLRLAQGTLKKGTKVQIAVPYRDIYDNNYIGEEGEWMYDNYYEFQNFPKIYIKVVDKTGFIPFTISGQQSTNCIGFKELLDALDAKHLKVDRDGWLLNERK